MTKKAELFIPLEEFIERYGLTTFMRVAGQKCYGRMDHLEREQSIIIVGIDNIGGESVRVQVWLYGTNPKHRELAEMAAAHYKLKGNT